MTTRTLDRPLPPVGPERADEAPPFQPPGAPASAPAASPAGRPSVRPVLVAALSSIAAALMVGGIFGSWPARLLGVAAAIGGAAWAWAALIRPSLRLLLHLLFVPLVVVAAVLSVVVSANGASPLRLLGDAVAAGRLLRPPVPFDPGWRPVLVVLFASVGFGAAWVGAALGRPRAGLLLPLPILAIAAVSQPASGEFVAGVLGVTPIVAALAILFGDQAGADLSRQFETRRAVRAVLALVPVGGLVLALGHSSFLFPKPVYSPAQKPQKPRALPLSAARDRVLFTVDSTLTGPWRIGVLDTYDGHYWLLPPFDPHRLRGLSASGVVDSHRAATVTVRFTVRDLGTTDILPSVATPATALVPSLRVNYDPRTDLFRTSTGRVPGGLSYTMTLPPYPSAAQLHAAPAPGRGFGPFLDIPPAPRAVADLLARAPSNRWDRLNFLLTRLNSVVVAAGAGVPGEITPSKVADLLAGSHKGNPFQIVAAEAMLSRWAGVPSRIGFGFDQGQREGGAVTIRPRNAIQYLEVYFRGYGWVPIIGSPPRAESSLDASSLARASSSTEPSDDVAVAVFIPVQLQNLRALYQELRLILLEVLPVAAALAAAYVALPWVQKTRRRSRRRRWAAGEGPIAEIAVEYAEIRDLASDLGVGDPDATPLEYLAQVAVDEEHEEMAWLVTRTLYGDLTARAGPEDAEAARRLGRSLRTRLARAQPFQTRALAALSRTSLREPYTTEVPTVRLLEPARALARSVRPVAVVLAAARRSLVRAAAEGRRRILVRLPRRGRARPAAGT